MLFRSHRYPFLFVDRITEFEVDKRIVGIKNVSLNERYLSHSTHGAPVLPPTILTEAVAQVGAILILAKPENRQRLIVDRKSVATAAIAVTRASGVGVVAVSVSVTDGPPARGGRVLPV